MNCKLVMEDLAIKMSTIPQHHLLVSIAITCPNYTTSCIFIDLWGATNTQRHHDKTEAAPPSRIITKTTVCYLIIMDQLFLHHLHGVNLFVLLESDQQHFSITAPPDDPDQVKVPQAKTLRDLNPFDPVHHRLQILCTHSGNFLCKTIITFLLNKLKNAAEIQWGFMLHAFLTSCTKYIGMKNVSKSICIWLFSE